MPASAGSGTSGNPTRVCHRESRPLCARLHHMGAQRLRCEPDVALTRALISRRLLRRTRRKEEANEMKGNAGACGEGSQLKASGCSE